MWENRNQNINSKYEAEYTNSKYGHFLHSITHVILFHRTNGYLSVTNNIPATLFRDDFRVKNMGSVHYWHPFFCNLAHSKTQQFFPLALEETLYLCICYGNE